MNKRYLNFISFARGIQNGYNTNDIPLLDEENAKQVYDKALSSLCSSFDIEQDILEQYYDGYLDAWEATEQLEDELGYSYDEAHKKVSGVRVNPIVSAMREFNHVFSMAKINDNRTVPSYLHHKLDFSIINWDHWVGDDEDGRNCTKIACEYAVGGVHFFFCFSRGLNKSLMETPQGEALEFKALVAQVGKGSGDCRWYAREFNPRDFESVRQVVHDKDDDAVSVLGLTQVDINSPFDFIKSSFGVSSGVRRRKRSKYHGALVDNTFDDVSTGLSTPSTTASGSLSASIKTHPSIRFLVVNHILHPTRRHLVKSSLSGSMDTLLYQTYCACVGEDKVSNDVKHTGKNGRVELTFNSDSGHSTLVDLGGSLEVGYVVQQIDDGLGLFPEGTEVGDLINNDVIQEIVRGQAEREKGEWNIISEFNRESPFSLITSSSEYSWIFSMARMQDPDNDVPSYLHDLFSGLPLDGWFGDDVNPKLCNKFSAQIGVSPNYVFYFTFKRGSDSRSLAEAPSGNAYQFCSLYLQMGSQWFKRDGLSQSDFNKCKELVRVGDVSSAVEELGMESTTSRNPLA